MGKFTGSVFIAVGSTIGARILTLPFCSMNTGFMPAIAVLFFVWATMTLSALLILRLSLAMDEASCTFSGMAKELMGPLGRAVTWITSLLLMYSLIGAYTAGNTVVLGDLLASVHIRLPGPVIAVIFMAAFGWVVSCGARVTDYVNRPIMIIKGGAMVCAIALLLSHMKSDYLQGKSLTDIPWGEGGIMAMVPNFLCAFGFHNVIPSLRVYNSDKPERLKWIILASTTASLVIYIGWICVTMGTVSGQNLARIGGGPDSTWRFISVLVDLANSRAISFFMMGFINTTMAVAFLGTALSLFDFLTDGLKGLTWQSSRQRKILVALLTFLPPLAFTIFCPKGFLLALGYAAIFTAILFLIVPAIMSYRLHKKLPPGHTRHAFRKSAFLFALACVGGAVILMQLLYGG